MNTEVDTQRKIKALLRKRVSDFQSLRFIKLRQVRYITGIQIDHQGNERTSIQFKSHISQFVNLYQSFPDINGL